MTQTNWFARGLAVLLLAAAAAASAAEPFPVRPVKIVVNTAPGGLTDITTRLIAQKMGEKLGQSVVIDNRAGGDGLLGIRTVKAAPADGYTLLASAGTIAIQPAVKQDPGYDLLKDFAPVGPMIRSPLLMVVAADQPDKTLQDFMARARANPAKLSYASAGVGTTTHIGAAMFLQQAGLNMLHVPYKGNGAAMPDVMSGRVGMIFEAYGSGASKVKEGRLRALGVTSTRRLPGLPDVPTIAEQGVPNYSYYLYLALLAPAGTPKDVVQRLSEALRSALASKDLLDRFRDDGSEPMDMSSEQFTEFLRRDLQQMARLVGELGLTKQ
ncbi:MAG TPA: tripartite tricarboxylate transporter substrate binding protein [Ramlibacter sp.]|nr:tripartite tricarboxylate transporter substrate binding protein [Ramlibacter sp.]